MAVNQKPRRQIAVLSLLALTGAASRGLDGPDKRRRRRSMSQKQSLLIASPSGRGARTQDHLGIIYILIIYFLARDVCSVVWIAVEYIL